MELIDIWGSRQVPEGVEELPSAGDIEVNRTSFTDLYHVYVGRVYQYIRCHSPTPEDAADLTQQVFLQAWQALPRYRQQGVPFAAWLFRIARNAVIDAQRRRRHLLPWQQVPHVFHPLSPEDPERAVLADETRRHLHELIAALPAPKREVLLLRFAARLPTAQIAAVIGKSEAATQKQITRTLQLLKEHYNG